MASQAQMEANRRNALRSTGPRTAEGKSRVALNAVAHGLRAAKVVTGAEDGGLYDAVRAQLIDEWRPASVVEVLLTERIAELIWRLRRVAGVEVELIENTPKPRPPGFPQAFFDSGVALARDLRSAQPALLRVQLYQMRLERGLHRSLAELRRLQLDRQLQDDRPMEARLDPSPVDASLRDTVAIDATPSIIENGRTNPISCG